MKRPWRLSLPLLLAALLLSACGRSVPEPPSAKEAPPAVDTAPETEAPEVPSDLPEGAVPLTAEEIAQVNEAFESVYIEENLAYANPICCFFTSDYHRPEEIGLSEFLRHFSPGEGISDEAEFQALTKADGWPFGEITLEEMPVPVSKFLRADVDEALTEHAGITTADLTGVNAGNTSLLYLEEYDAYYNFVSDFGPGWFQCESGWYTDAEARLTGANRVLTLRKEDDRWLFASFLPLETE